VNDIQQAVQVIQPSIFSLFQSLNEERLFSEKEIKEKQLAREKESQEFLESIRRGNRPSSQAKVPQKNLSENSTTSS
jgi:hypothetical protein